LVAVVGWLICLRVELQLKKLYYNPAHELQDVVEKKYNMFLSISQADKLGSDCNIVGFTENQAIGERIVVEDIKRIIIVDGKLVGGTSTGDGNDLRGRVVPTGTDEEVSPVYENSS